MIPLNTIHFFRSLLKTAVDGCFLPGTMMGTEILWLYLLQWKKEMSTVSLALLSFAFSHFAFLSDITTLAHRTMNASENIQ